jgi:parallel beta helix pectate lyase-like protein
MRNALSAAATWVVMMLLVSSAAYAQATRTWVSGVGDDANPCSRTAPCKTFAGAISKTAAGGEINVLDPGGYGAVTITKSIRIISDHIEAGVLVSGTNGIVVNAAPTDNVLLDGLDIEGLGTGLHAVQIIGGASVVIRRTSINHFAGNGVNLAGTNNAKVLVQDCVISNNAGGVNVQGAAGALNNAVIDNTTIDTHTNFAVQIAGPGNIYLSSSQLIGTGPKLAISGSGTITSYGNNVIRGAGVAPSSTLPLQ